MDEHDQHIPQAGEIKQVESNVKPFPALNRLKGLANKKNLDAALEIAPLVVGPAFMLGSFGLLARSLRPPGYNKEMSRLLMKENALKGKLLALGIPAYLLYRRFSGG